MDSLPRPRVLVSACLVGDRVRYDGGTAVDGFALELGGLVEVIKICPEMELGLGTPRLRIRLVQTEEGVEAIQEQKYIPLTHRLVELAQNIADSNPPIDGALLKSRSPSCGVTGTKIYADRDGRDLLRRGRGIFAEELLTRLNNIPIEDEERLRRYKTLRLRFLLGILTSACIREGSWKEMAVTAENITGRRMNPKSLRNFYRRANTGELRFVLEHLLGAQRLQKLVGV